MVSNVTYLDQSNYFSDIAVDSRGYVHVAVYTAGKGPHTAVLDQSLRSVKNISLTSLQLQLLHVQYLQLVVDSTNAVYLFDSAWGSSTEGRVLVLSSRQWLQSASWRAPISLQSNITSQSNYVMAIDSDDYLYFQQINGYKMLYITSQKGQLQYTYQLGTGNASEPWIEDVVIDSQYRMWHTRTGDSHVSVVDSDGMLVAAYDTFSTSSYGFIHPIDIDLHNNIVVAMVWSRRCWSCHRRATSWTRCRRLSHPSGASVSCWPNMAEVAEVRLAVRCWSATGTRRMWYRATR